MKVGYFQFRPRFGEVSRNLFTVTTALRDADADLIVLPELAFSGYYFRDRDEAMSLADDPADSPVFDALCALCHEKRFYLVTGFAERNGNRCFNSAALIGPEGVMHVYRKLHLFHEEQNWFDPGDILLQVLNVKGVKVGIMVCYDWAFPEAARALTLKGAQVICHPCNLVLSYCQDAMVTRCVENRVFAVSANRYGTDSRPHGKLRFTGKSQIVAPGGRILHRGPAQRTELYVTEIDPSAADDKHVTELCDLISDRRPEHYGELVVSRESG